MIKKVMIVFMMLFALSACRQKPTTINIAGSTTVLPIVQVAAEAYMDRNPATNISVRGGGSSIGIKSVIIQTVDIGNASRRIDKLETDLMESEKVDLLETPIARDAIAIVVQKKNPVSDLSLEQLRKIYSGEVINWKGVGGLDQKIIVIARDFSSGSFLVFNETVLDSIKVIQNSIRLPSNNAVANAVGYTPGAIGYIGMGYLHDNLKLLSLEGIFPDSQTISTNSYKLSRLLYMYTSQHQHSIADDFIDFILSEEGQQIVEAQGYMRIN